MPSPVGRSNIPLLKRAMVLTHEGVASMSAPGCCWEKFQSTRVVATALFGEITKQLYAQESAIDLSCVKARAEQLFYLGFRKPLKMCAVSDGAG